MNLIKITRIANGYDKETYAVTSKDKFEISFEDLFETPEVTLELLTFENDYSEVKIID